MVELGLGVDIEGALVPLEAAIVEHGSIQPGTQCHDLVALSTCRVPKHDDLSPSMATNLVRIITSCVLLVGEYHVFYKLSTQHT